MPHKSFGSSWFRSAVVFAFCFAFGATGAFDVGELSGLPVMENGRIKPFDTYARNTLLRFSGRQALKSEKMSASQWLAEVVFAPESAAQRKAFLVNNPEMANALGISVEKRRRYSYAALASGIHKLEELRRTASKVDPRNRTPIHTEAIRLSEALNEYHQTASMFSFLTPFPEFTITDSTVAARLQVPEGQQRLSYLNLVTRSKQLSAAMQRIQATDRETWTDADKRILELTHAMYNFGKSAKDIPVHMVPGVSRDSAWLSPWGLAAQGAAGAHSEAMNLLLQMREDYRKGNQAAFDRSVGELGELVFPRMEKQYSPARLRLESFYNAVNPFRRAKALFLAGLLLALLTLAFPSRWLKMLSLVVLVIGIVPETFGIAARTFIMQRPPVINLFDTFVLVSWLGVLLGFAVEYFNKKSLGLIVAGVTGFAFLHIAGRYAADGDTMGVVVAVLDSNFWLATHVITIIMGYAGCMAAGVISHLYLIQRIMHPVDADRSRATARAVYGMLAFGLVFTTVGTVLGGIWADQSWGRFWGWDPKENGALLIVLWCSAVFHARAAGMIKHIGFAVGSVIGTVLVMFAWMGVNLLGVGLHSYGFTSNGAKFLFSFVGFETLFVLATLSAYAFRRKAANRAAVAG